MLKTLTSKVILALATLILINPIVAHAALVTCQPVNSQGEYVGCAFSQLVDTLVTIYNYLLGLAGLVALLYIIFGAIRMFYWTFMEAKEAELSAAKTTVSRAIVGLVIIAMAYLIVNTLIIWLGGGSISSIISEGLSF